MTNIHPLINSLSATLFWDTKIESIDVEKHAPYIIERVLSRGTWDEFKIILNHYGKENVGKIAINLRYLDRIVLAFCVTYFNLPQEKFRCYIQRQLKVSSWDY